MVAIAASLFTASRPSSVPLNLNQKVAQLSSQFRCPTCIGLNAEQSNASTARAIRHQIRLDLQHGQSPGQIKSFLLAHYGPMILMKPPAQGLAATVWLLPLVVIISAAILLGVAFKRWQRQVRAVSKPTDEDMDLVEQALKVQQSTKVEPESNGVSTRLKL